MPHPCGLKVRAPRAALVPAFCDSPPLVKNVRDAKPVTGRFEVAIPKGFHQISRMPRRLHICLLWGALLWLGTGCSREPTPPPASPPTAAAKAPADQGLSLAELFPYIGAVPDYAGAANCQECHEKQHQSWHQSYHRRMTQLPVPDAVQADFNNVVLTNQVNRYTLSRKQEEFWVRKENSPAGGAASEAQDLPLGLVTGSHHMQVFWTPVGLGNCQMGFPFTWLIPEKRWVPRHATFLRPPNLEHQRETWNFVCARCHSTGAQPNYDPATKNWRTQVADLGISCEACHGPGERHVQAQQELRRLGRKPAPGATNLFIVHPEKLSAERASQICGFCHSMKSWDTQEGWPKRGFSFRPGDNLEATTPVMRPKEVEKQPWLKAALQKNPDLFDDFFWPDGMVRVSGRDYNGLIESPCHRGGQFSCLSCHSMHDSDPDDQLARKRAGNRACTQCHERFRETAAVTAHTRHLAGSSGSECYNCHMPHTTYGVLSAIRSHQVSSPKVADQQATGRPNACNLCHLDKTLAWTAGQLARWYQQPLPTLSAPETQIADSVRLALTGDAGQRVLIAWHLGWEPAMSASGRSWLPPVLGQLLDDPYAAVRCVAARSLKTLPGFTLQDYDFTVAPTDRPEIQTALLENWLAHAATKTSAPPPAATLVRRENPAAMRESFRELSRQRNERPVRLRE